MMFQTFINFRIVLIFFFRVNLAFFKGENEGFSSPRWQMTDVFAVSQHTKTNSAAIFHRICTSKVFFQKCLVWSHHLAPQPTASISPSLSPLTHWQKSFTTFGLGSSLPLLVANWKRYPRKFHWQRGFLALAPVVRLGLIGVNKMPLPKLKNHFVSETRLRFCAIDLRINFLALAIASKKIFKTISETCTKWSQFGAVSETRV